MDSDQASFQNLCSGATLSERDEKINFLTDTDCSSIEDPLGGRGPASDCFVLECSQQFGNNSSFSQDSNCYSADVVYNGHTERKTDSLGEQNGSYDILCRDSECHDDKTKENCRLLTASDNTVELDDGESSEKDEDKADEDDDDLTKKLLSIQVLPRIPKIKRTEVAGGGTMSDNNVPQRSVLERAEITTKSSSYPKWPKSNGSQPDDKPRWRGDNKGKDANNGQRGKRVNELNTKMPERSNGHVFTRPPSSNFTKQTELEKSRSTFTRRVPCEMLFDAIMAKENSQTVQPLDEKSNNFDCNVSNSQLCSSDLWPGEENKGTAKKRYCDEKNSSHDDKLRRTSKTRFTNSDAKELKNQRHEDAGSQGVPSEQSKHSHPMESSRTNASKLSFNSGQRTFHSFSPLSEKVKFGDLKDNADLGYSSGTSETKLATVASCAVPFPAPVAGTTVSMTEDARFKLPTVPRVHRSKNMGQNFVKNGSARGFPQPADSPLPWKRSDNCADLKTTHSENPNLSTMELEEEVIEWGPEDGVEPQKPPKKTHLRSPSPKSSLSASHSANDSSVEVVDMDVVASPLCDDNLSVEPVGPVASGASVNAARKVVTFDCPEDAGTSHRDGSKRHKSSKCEKESSRQDKEASKRDKEEQRSLFETKRDIQEQVVSVMKEILRPLYSKRKINKEEYKEIMRQAVPKICHNRKSQVPQSRKKKKVPTATLR